MQHLLKKILASVDSRPFLAPFPTHCFRVPLLVKETVIDHKTFNDHRNCLGMRVRGCQTVATARHVLCHAVSQVCHLRD